MTDRYQDFVSSAVGRRLAKKLGLPDPVRLDRYVAGSPLAEGRIGVGGVGCVRRHPPGVLDALGIETTTPPTRVCGQMMLGA